MYAHALLTVYEALVSTHLKFTFSFIAERPKLQQLLILKHNEDQVRIIDEISGSWSYAAIAFGFDGPSIDQIKLSSQQQAREACRMMMTEWLKGAKRGPPTWGTLVRALQDAEFVDLADKLLNVLK